MVKSFVREKTETAKFDATARKVQALFTKGERIVALNNPLMQICIYGIMIFLLTQGSRLILTTRGRLLDIGQFSTLLTYSFQILGSLMMVSMILVMLTFTEESGQRVREVLEEKAPSLRRNSRWKRSGTDLWRSTRFPSSMKAVPGNRCSGTSPCPSGAGKSWASWGAPAAGNPPGPADPPTL